MKLWSINWIRRNERIISTVLIIAIGLAMYMASNKRSIYTRYDTEGYYMYLPAIFIYQGFDSIPLVTPSGYFPKIKETNNHYNKYPMGVAILQAPFFAIGCAIAEISSEYTIDGYSLPFQWTILMSTIFYVCLGMHLLYRLLRRRFSIASSAISVLCIFLGTNLFFYTYISPGMAHAYGFFLWCALLLYIFKTDAEPVTRNFLMLGMILGVLILVRPTNALALPVILLWRSNDNTRLLNSIVTSLRKIVLLGLPLLILVAAQLLLWKMMLGETVFYSYNREPGFIYWSSPKISNVLFHVHNGLLIYAPILSLAFIGLIHGIFKRQRNFILIAIVMSLALYIFASWWAWWFGGAYGHRCFVDFLPLLCIPLAYAFEESFKNRVLTVVVIAVSVLLTWYSIEMTQAYQSPWDGPGFGWTEYWQIVRSWWPLG